MSIFNRAKKLITRLLMDDLRQNIGDVIRSPTTTYPARVRCEFDSIGVHPQQI